MLPADSNAAASSRPPRVSVVIPTHNRPQMLAEAVDSVLAQSFRELEIVIVDDGSQPPVDAAPWRGQPLRVLRNEQPQGVCAARNRGITEARGRWVALLDDDDRWLPQKLERQLAAMETSGSRWSFTGRHQVRSDGSVERAFHPDQVRHAADELLLGNRIGTPSTVIAERDLLLEAGLFSLDISVLADWDMWLRLHRLAAPAPVAEPLIDYVVHEGGMHRTKIADVQREHALLAERLGLGKQLGGLTFWVWLGQTLRHSGERRRGTLMIARAVLRHPLQGVAQLRRVAARRLGRRGR